MPILAPTFSLTIGSFTSNTDNPVGGPRRILVARDMDVPADALRLHLMARAGIGLGDEVTVRLGHDGEEETVFTGNVAALRPAIVGVEIQAIGKMNALLNLRTSATYENQTAGSIARDLIGQAGLSAGTVDDGPTLPRYAVDRRLSAFAHLKELADRLGYELHTSLGGNVMFHALGPAAGLDSALGAAALPALGGGESYVFGQHLVEAASGRWPPSWGTIDVGGESPMSGEGVPTAHWLTPNDADYRGSAGDGVPRLLVIDPAARTKDLADRFASGILAVAARKSHQIEVTVLGRPQVELGDAIATSDLPDELISGSGYVRAMRHRFGEKEGFLTDFRISVGVD